MLGSDLEGDLNFELVTKGVAFALTIILWVIGGQKKGRVRDTYIPILLGLPLFLWLHGDSFHKFIVTLMTCGSANIIRLGYGNYSPEDDPEPSLLAMLTKDRGGAIIRLLWGVAVGIVLPLFLVTFRFLPFPKYLLYILLNAGINYGGCKLKLPVTVMDIVVSAGAGGIVFLI